MPHALTLNTAANGSSSEAASRRNFWGLTLGCIGVVYGDIGTSPLYRAARIGAGGGRQSDCERGRHSRHPFADRLGADPRCYRQICADPPPRRQRRRRWNAGFDGACLSRARGQELRHRRARRRQRRAVLRRRVDHPGDFGFVGGRRPQGGRSRSRIVCRPADRVDPFRLVRGAVPRHRQGRRLLRPDHPHLVHRHRRRGLRAHRPESGPRCAPSIPSMGWLSSPVMD